MLYFLSILSIAMRYGLREVLIAGMGTALGYLLVVLAMSETLQLTKRAAWRAGAHLHVIGSG